ncbi:hypothetical protein ACN95_10170 [Gordonia sihwensis]|uniref:hypothetical protein n=1 Tax=Gordonia sihwensis TaxID=173559 RepID=UPI001C92F304|nr:hypothetical protein [Gordonia sihwensis]MBY4570382.1 hypothetical protein [Gordonia sihwensis]
MRRRTRGTSAQRRIEQLVDQLLYPLLNQEDEWKPEPDTPEKRRGGADDAEGRAASTPDPSTDGRVEHACKSTSNGPAVELLEPADKRRAAQLLRYAHPEHPDINGINRMITEAHHNGRLTNLTLAVAAIAYAVSELATDAGQSGLAELALDQHHQEKK